MDKISRFVFNFRDRCNMKCPFCYIPFVESEAGDISLWEKIIDVMAQYSPELVTFGGGDPFAHQNITELLNYCQRYDFQVHVDTNGLFLPISSIPKLNHIISLIGLPIDGSMEFHDCLRNHSGHYKIICGKLAKLAEHQIPVKINTVYYPEEKTQLDDIAKRICQYSNIKQWFIYEYWYFKGINPESKEHDKFHPNDEEIERLRIAANVPEIHFSSIAERSPCYVFVSSLGNIYTVSENTKEYIELGNILSNDAGRILSSLTNIKKIEQRTRLKLYQE